jgi:uncharacterized protein YcfJ
MGFHAIGGVPMKHAFKVLLATTACGLMIASASPADAKGCIKGAVVGGVAGHMAGHGVLGAAGGCAVGHHMANKTDRTNSDMASPQQPAQGYSQNRP